MVEVPMRLRALVSMFVCSVLVVAHAGVPPVQDSSVGSGSGYVLPTFEDLIDAEDDDTDPIPEDTSDPLDETIDQLEAEPDEAELAFDEETAGFGVFSKTLTLPLLGRVVIKVAKDKTGKGGRVFFRQVSAPAGSLVVSGQPIEKSKITFKIDRIDVGLSAEEETQIAYSARKVRFKTTRDVQTAIMTGKDIPADKKYQKMPFIRQLKARIILNRDNPVIPFLKNFPIQIDELSIDWGETRTASANVVVKGTVFQAPIQVSFSLNGQTLQAACELTDFKLNMVHEALAGTPITDIPFNGACRAAVWLKKEQLLAGGYKPRNFTIDMVGTASLDPLKSMLAPLADTGLGSLRAVLYVERGKQVFASIGIIDQPIGTFGIVENAGFMVSYTPKQEADEDPYEVFLRDRKQRLKERIEKASPEEIKAAAEVLGVPENATVTLLRTAYKEKYAALVAKAQEAQPEGQAASGKKANTPEIKALNDAYLVLNQRAVAQAGIERVETQTKGSQVSDDGSTFSKLSLTQKTAAVPAKLYVGIFGRAKVELFELKIPLALECTFDLLNKNLIFEGILGQEKGSFTVDTFGTGVALSQSDVGETLSQEQQTPGDVLPVSRAFKVGARGSIYGKVVFNTERKLFDCACVVSTVALGDLVQEIKTDDIGKCTLDGSLRVTVQYAPDTSKMDPFASKKEREQRTTPGGRVVINGSINLSPLDLRFEPFDTFKINKLRCDGLIDTRNEVKLSAAIETDISIAELGSIKGGSIEISSMLVPKKDAPKEKERSTNVKLKGNGTVVLFDKSMPVAVSAAYIFAKGFNFMGVIGREIPLARPTFDPFASEGLNGAEEKSAEQDIEDLITKGNPVDAKNVSIGDVSFNGALISLDTATSTFKINGSATALGLRLVMLFLASSEKLKSGQSGLKVSLQASISPETKEFYPFKDIPGADERLKMIRLTELVLLGGIQFSQKTGIKGSIQLTGAASLGSLIGKTPEEIKRMPALEATARVMAEVSAESETGFNALLDASVEKLPTISQLFPELFENLPGTRVVDEPGQDGTMQRVSESLDSEAVRGAIEFIDLIRINNARLVISTKEVRRGSGTQTYVFDKGINLLADVTMDFANERNPIMQLTKGVLVNTGQSKAGFQLKAVILPSAIRDSSFEIALGAGDLGVQIATAVVTRANFAVVIKGEPAVGIRAGFSLIPNPGAQPLEFTGGVFFNPYKVGVVCSMKNVWMEPFGVKGFSFGNLGTQWKQDYASIATAIQSTAAALTGVGAAGTAAAWAQALLLPTDFGLAGETTFVRGSSRQRLEGELQTQVEEELAKMLAEDTTKTFTPLEQELMRQQVFRNLVYQRTCGTRGRSTGAGQDNDYICARLRLNVGKDFSAFGLDVALENTLSFVDFIDFVAQQVGTIVQLQDPSPVKMRQITLKFVPVGTKVGEIVLEQGFGASAYIEVLDKEACVDMSLALPDGLRLKGKIPSIEVGALKFTGAHCYADSKYFIACSSNERKSYESSLETDAGLQDMNPATCRRGDPGMEIVAGTAGFSLALSGDITLDKLFRSSTKLYIGSQGVDFDLATKIGDLLDVQARGFAKLSAKPIDFEVEIRFQNNVLREIQKLTVNAIKVLDEAIQTIDPTEQSTTLVTIDFDALATVDDFEARYNKYAEEARKLEAETKAKEEARRAAGEAAQAETQAQLNTVEQTIATKQREADQMTVQIEEKQKTLTALEQALAKTREAVDATRALTNVTRQLTALTRINKEREGQGLPKYASYEEYAVAQQESLGATQADIERTREEIRAMFERAESLKIEVKELTATGDELKALVQQTFKDMVRDIDIMLRDLGIRKRTLLDEIFIGILKIIRDVTAQITYPAIKAILSAFSVQSLYFKGSSKEISDGVLPRVQAQLLVLGQPRLIDLQLDLKNPKEAIPQLAKTFFEQLTKAPQAASK